MQLNQLYYFSEVVNMGSISKAANNLHISQPSLSTTIKNLETEFEQPLFKRTKHGVIPTEFGQRVYDDYMKIKHIIDHLPFFSLYHTFFMSHIYQGAQFHLCDSVAFGFGIRSKKHEDGS